MQRLKEVQVKVFLAGEEQPVQGYLTNYGASYVRFRDVGNKIEVDDLRVTQEPDIDLVKMCYKRLRRNRHNETMAFPGFESPLADARAVEIQRKERNVFENVGLESSWKIEFLARPAFQSDRPDRCTNRISSTKHCMTKNSRKSFESKRFENRNDNAFLSVKNISERSGTKL